MTANRDALLRLYYLATPLFAVVDLLAGMPIRAAFFDDLRWRLLYYLLCVGCAVVVHRRPRVAPLVGMGESAVNLTLLVVGVMLPIFSLPEQVLAGETVGEVVTTARLVNFMLAGTALVLAFNRQQLALARALGGRR